MVLSFRNIVTLKGGSEELRDRCFKEINEAGWLLTMGDYIEGSEGVAMELKTVGSPLDDRLLEVASKYLALDFVVNFNAMEDAVLDDWKGCIRIIDQTVYYTDNYEASDTYTLGSIYELSANGGIRKCLENYPS